MGCTGSRPSASVLVIKRLAIHFPNLVFISYEQCRVLRDIARCLSWCGDLAIPSHIPKKRDSSAEELCRRMGDGSKGGPRCRLLLSITQHEFPWIPKCFEKLRNNQVRISLVAECREIFGDLTASASNVLSLARISSILRMEGFELLETDLRSQNLSVGSPFGLYLGPL